MKRKRTMTIVYILLLLLLLTGCGTPEEAALPDVGSGYVDAVFEKTTDRGDAFLACGAGGRLDRIYEDGTFETIVLPMGDSDLTSILVTEEITIVAGTSGAIAHSRDGIKFESSKGAGKEHISGLAQFNGKFYASTQSGKILSSADGISWKSGEKLSDKPIIAMAASSSYLMAVTEDTDILKSEDGVTWNTQNYNTVYDGLADAQSFSNIIGTNENLYILGRTKNPDAPSVMYSSDGGGLWSYVSSMELNNRPPEEFYPLTIYSVALFGGELLAACDSGRLLTFTDCPSCNEIVTVKNADMRCISVSDDTVLVAGDQFEFSVLSREELQNLSMSVNQD